MGYYMLSREKSLIVRPFSGGNFYLVLLLYELMYFFLIRCFLFFLLGVFSFYRVVTSFDQQFHPIYFIFIIVGLVLTTLFIICLRLDVNKRINYVLMTVALSFSILSIEVYFEFFPRTKRYQTGIRN